MHGISATTKVSFAESFLNNDLILLGGSIAALLFAEIFLRFMPIAAFHTRRRLPLAIIEALLRSFGFGLSHFRIVVCHVLSLRLILVAFYSLLFVLPIVTGFLRS